VHNVIVLQAYLRDVLVTVLGTSQDEAMARSASLLLLDSLVLHHVATEVPWCAEDQGVLGDDDPTIYTRAELGWDLLLDALEGMVVGENANAKSHEKSALPPSPCRPLNCELVAGYILAVIERDMNAHGGAACPVLNSILRKGEVDKQGKKLGFVLLKALKSKSYKCVCFVQQLFAMIAIHDRTGGGTDNIALDFKAFAWELRPQILELDYETKRLLLHTCVCHKFRLELTEAVLRSSREYGTQLVPAGAGTKSASLAGMPLSQEKLTKFYFWLIPWVVTEMGEGGASGGGGGGGGGRPAAKSPTKLNKKNGKGETKVHTKALQDTDAAATEMRALLKQGANPNTVDNNGISPLMDACGRGHFQAAAVLLEGGADPNVVGSLNTNHTTALLETIAFVRTILLFLWCLCLWVCIFVFRG
jgi:hypothetical protein